ncbi:MAG: hypothetical protein HQK83_03155 [Fibrobacteria bacterium]|nr:hypothetical protein [Fibrobacteria bacterium]
MKKILIYSLPGFLSLLFMGCGMAGDKKYAEVAAEAFLKERLEQGGYGSKDQYSDIFWENTKEEKWEGIKKLVSKAMGQIKGYSLNTWNIEKKANTDGVSGTFVTLLYDVEYERGKGQETITMHRGLGFEEFKILGLNFTSDEIQKLIDEGVEKVVNEKSE